MSPVIHQPHDRFFKLSLREPKVALEFFTEHLPKTVLEKINLASLKLENHSFIDEHFKGAEADIVYQVQSGTATAYLYLLCEHQSTVDHLMAFRLWVYMTRLMESHLKQHPGQPLPLVYSLVIYTGQEPWNAPLDIFSLYGAHQDLAKAWLLKPFQLLDIHQIPDDQMRKRQWCGVVEFALKNKQVRDFQRFLKILLPWLHDLEESGVAGFSLSKSVLKYTLDGIEADDRDLFVQSVREYLSPALGDEIMTLAQQFILQGQQQGMQQGIQQGMQQGEAAVMTRLLKHRFSHQISEACLTRIQTADAQTLLQWSERILEAKTLEEVFQEVEV